VTRRLEDPKGLFVVSWSSQRDKYSVNEKTAIELDSISSKDLFGVSWLGKPDKQMSTTANVQVTLIFLSMELTYIEVPAFQCCRQSLCHLNLQRFQALIVHKISYTPHTRAGHDLFPSECFWQEDPIQK